MKQPFDDATLSCLAEPQGDERESAPRTGEAQTTLPAAEIGVLSAVDGDGAPWVAHPDVNAGEPVLARTTVRLGKQDVGREVVLAFAGGDPRRPIVLGCLLPRADAPADDAPESLNFAAGQRITFRCGEASLTLTRAGKVLVRGAYLLSRSSGVNRIQGGSVLIN